MARRTTSPAQKQKRALQEKRGTGRGRDFRPYIQVQEVPSRGRSTRIAGKVSGGRRHELLSDNERAVVMSLDNAIGVEDIREQVPLDMSVTVEIAARAGITHPKVNGDAVVMTTDVVADVATSDGPVPSAIAIKSAADLCDMRIIEKLEIERRFWAGQGISWQISTDREMSAERKQHDQWLHNWETLEDVEEPHSNYWSELKKIFIEELTVSSKCSIGAFLADFDNRHSHKKGHCLLMIRHLLACKDIRLNRCLHLDYSGDTDQIAIRGLD